MIDSSPRPLEEDLVKFIFKFTVFEVIAQAFNRQLVVKFGLKTSVIQLDAIRYLYFRDLKDQKMSEITVAVSKGQRLRRVRIYADLKEERFLDLWHYLKDQNPEADISGLPTIEAYRLMGSKNYPWLAVAGVMCLGVLLVAVLGTPLLRHGLDQGTMNLDLERSYQRLESSSQERASLNVTFRGWIDMERAWRLKERQGSYSEIKIVAPVYPSSIDTQASPLPQTKFVVLARNDEALQLLKQTGVIEMQGVLRTIWWEGLGSLAAQKLRENGAVLSPQTELIELGEIKEKRRDDLVMYLMSVGVLSLITLVTTLYLKPPSYSSST